MIIPLERRDINCYSDSYGYRRCSRTGWSNWGRWVVLGLVILVFLAFVSCLCLSSRRRRRRGARPMYGTGWMAPGPAPPYNAPNPTYNPPPGGNVQYAHYGNSGPPPPDYSSRPAGQGEYAPPPGPPPGQQTGVEMPKPTHGNQGYEMR
ncbi:hypothetical protein EJ06DRAFT_532350 [Trichodelitschia bisporula]|uniref:Chitin synthesis regulation, resistance to congo red-domain-containing protein n=1 Tax=Trichodelitschia bisporula TaxID=703511 RepID=A0A6G1HPK5_9PEZI|nr:hypothetical protein EJ06DRAFT_532350 [Trichodelitschia bisporula]